ncbi:MAG TPA: hypothetical protein HA306_03685 [Methanosarcina sp.]|nr:hypothetical protein [Methanosarcina sp.]
MGKQENKKQKRQWMVLAFAIGAALGSLYGAFILGPALGNIMEGVAIGISIGIGAGVSLGTFVETGTRAEKISTKENRLLTAVVIATLLLVLSTAFMAYSEFS